jgi:hypothetical protein
VLHGHGDRFQLLDRVCRCVGVAPPDAFSKTNKKTLEYSLWGDLPYSDVQATTGVPNLIADPT